MTITYLLSFVFALTLSAQQKRTFGTDNFSRMPTITSRGISDNGNLVWYAVSPLQYGDPYIVAHQLHKGITDTFHRAKRIWVASDGSWVAYVREPRYDEVRKAKFSDPKAAEKFNDTLVVKVLSGQTGKETLYPGLKSVIMPSLTGGSYVAALLKPESEATPPADTISAPDFENNESKTPLQSSKKAKKEKSYRLIIINPLTGNEFLASKAVSAEWSPYGKYLVWATQPVDTIAAQQLSLFIAGLWKPEPCFLSEGYIKHTSFSADESKLAFLEQPDTSNNRKNRVFLCDDLNKLTFRTLFAPDSMNFNPHEPLYFLKRTNRLITNVTYPGLPETADSLLKEERYSVDIWSWNDPFLQSQQLKNLAREKKRGYSAVTMTGNDTVRLIETEELRQSNLNSSGTGNLVLLWDDRKYAVETTWKATTRNDLYLLDLSTMGRRLVSEGHEGSMSISPDDSSLVWYDRGDSAWYCMNVHSPEAVCLTCGHSTAFYNELFDNPATAPSYGIAGWGDNGRSLLLNSRYDIWKFDLDRKTPPVCLTSDGTSNQSIVYRYIRTEPMKLFLRTRDHMILSAFNTKTKEAGYASLQYNRPGKPDLLVMSSHKYSALEKGRKTDQLIWRREGFNEFPEIWTGPPSFKGQIKLSNLGDCYSSFYHGKAQLVKWQATDGRQYEGLLSIPENHTEGVKLPMIVTFYERQSDDINRYRNFSPSRSVINTAEYLSHGYVIFEPDIIYGTGTPGEDALNAVESGTKYILSMGIVDSARIGIQGQSWGGYQVAYIVTQTNIFAAAMAGAAVSNMTSAYNAIRWESGKARLFQYEEGQSRIGSTLWDSAALIKYLNNSPLFFADSINTPLLMMHNDNDGAVPWSQSVELYLALRRLNKPSWLLVYNDESHNLTKWPNRIDLNIRMKQFFDHYLKDMPPPAWMTDGRPAILKGLDDCYRLND